MQEILCSNKSIGSYILRFAMASKYSHSVVYDPELEIITHTTLLGGGVKELSKTEFDKHYPVQSTPKDMNIPVEKQQEARDWLFAQVGKKYDWTALCSIALQCFTSRSWQDEDRWFCSELTEALRTKLGIPRFAVGAGWITPKHQYMVL